MLQEKWLVFIVENWFSQTGIPKTCCVNKFEGTQILPMEEIVGVMDCSDF